MPSNQCSRNIYAVGWLDLPILAGVTRVRHDRSMATIDVLGVPHTYELTPPTDNAPVLVFIHGWLLSRQYWAPLIQQISPKYQCLSYDLRGFGQSATLGAEVSAGIANDPLTTRHLIEQSPSTTPAAMGEQNALVTEFTPAAYARDLQALLDQLQIQHAWLLGHSLGGSVALWSADLMPEQVQGVICINSGGGIYLKEEFEKFRSAGQWMLQFRPAWLGQLPLLDWLFSRASMAKPVDRRWGKQRVIDFISAHPQAARGTLLDSTTPEEVHLLPRVIARLQQPVYFIAGSCDTVMEPRYVRHLASFHRSFQAGEDNVIEIPDCGHMSMIEQTAAIAQQLETILQRHIHQPA